MKLKMITYALCLTLSSFNLYAEKLQLQEAHPQTYQVVKGDTLWDISSLFLKSPWLWPHLWKTNKQISDPHWIYPGDKLNLIWVNGEPQLVRKRTVKLSPTIRLHRKEKAIPMIPLNRIATFLSRDHIIDATLVKNSPRLVGNANSMQHFIAGDVIYAQGQYDNDKLYGIYRLNEALIDPKTEENLGSLLTFIGISKVSKDKNVYSNEQVTAMYLIKSTQEARQGDLLLPLPEQDFLPAYFLPTSVDKSLTGQLLGSLNATSLLGKGDVVMLNKGRRDGIEPGAMFSIMRGGPAILVNDKEMFYKEKTSIFKRLGKKDISLPKQKVGELMVFKIYKKTSIALIMSSTNVINSHALIQGLNF
ncbi:LysM peptidoglycan-binding domain-containing protein [Psychromonas sp. CD1]|uniref:LysM peptidoglycan-binding domain-containing protein n=1 Tax=Psychromonas sp. CD1 TaxID=1979839 RepID=UPI000B9A5396|nr:LysM peptidoglycan-binding domain-containing protein [Psychromonas sp. CD1]